MIYGGERAMISNEKFVIKGDNELRGVIENNGAKNSGLPTLVASLLSNEKIVIKNIPHVEDINIIIKILENLGVKAFFEDNKVIIYPHSINKCIIPKNLGSKIRVATLLFPPLLKKFKEVKLPYPGGCDIGTRKIDLHISSLQKLGVTFKMNSEYIEGKCRNLEGAKIDLPFPSVGATEQTMIAATLAKGTTFISNAAKEPEIVDLAIFLNKMGAKIEGAGTNTIRITGVKELNGVEYTIMPDRINAGTYMVAAGITHGDVLIKNINLKHLGSVVSKLCKAGVEIIKTNRGVRVTAPKKFHPVDIITEVHPGFPTDMQPIITPLLALANGKSTIRETIFDNRFNHVPELRKMGADIKVIGDTAIVNGVDGLKEAKVTATDLRAGAALVLAGLAAEGETIIDNVYQIDRGYEDIERKLRGIGADIKRID